MVNLIIKKTFTANHAVTLPLGPEETHGHNWNLEVELETSHDKGNILFIQGAVDGVITPLEHFNLNKLAPLQPNGATAESLAKYIFDEITNTLNTDDYTVKKVTLEEEKGCWASYIVR
jgi:6-pyruvoyl-tetrahydropterin synthase